MRSILLLACSFLYADCFSQTTLNYQPAVEGFEYIEVVKGANNANDTKLPLLIAFHYSSGNPAETIADYDSVKNPVRIIIPKGNYRKRNGFSYYPVDYYKNDSLTQFSLSKATVDSIAGFVRAIGKKYRQKAIVSGISQGGDIAFLLARYYPELCLASFPFAAVINPEVVRGLKDKAVRKIPVHLFQGEDDKIVAVQATRKKVEAIGNKLQIRFYTYPGVGHDISPQMKADYSRLIDEMIK